MGHGGYARHCCAAIAAFLVQRLVQALVKDKAQPPGGLCIDASPGILRFMKKLLLGSWVEGRLHLLQAIGHYGLTIQTA